MTDDTYVRAVELREDKGWSYPRIAKATGLSEATLLWRFLRDGVERPRPYPLRPKGPPAVDRKGVTVRRFSEQEDATIRAMSERGHGPMDIARALPGRKHPAIIARLRTLARYDERDV